LPKVRDYGDRKGNFIRHVGGACDYETAEDQKQVGAGEVSVTCTALALNIIAMLPSITTMMVHMYVPGAQVCLPSAKNRSHVMGLTEVPGADVLDLAAGMPIRL
jgi:hypothetical protein